MTTVTATTLNALILFSIGKTSSLHKPSFVLLANLALIDFLAGAVAEPLVFIANVAALERWSNLFCFCSLGARVVGYWLGSISLYTLTVISVDRLLAIRLKNRYRSIVTVKRVAAVLLPWWIGIFVAVLSAFVTHTSIKIQLSNRSRDRRFHTAISGDRLLFDVFLSLKKADFLGIIEEYRPGRPGENKPQL
jgi:hypothetical protein